MKYAQVEINDKDYIEVKRNRAWYTSSLFSVRKVVDGLIITVPDNDLEIFKAVEYLKALRIEYYNSKIDKIKKSTEAYLQSINTSKI